MAALSLYSLSPGLTGLVLCLVACIPAILLSPILTLGVFAIMAPNGSLNDSFSLAFGPLGNWTLFHIILLASAAICLIVYPQKISRAATSPVGVAGLLVGTLGVTAALVNQDYARLYWAFHIGAGLIALAVCFESQGRLRQTIETAIVWPALFLGITVLIEYALQRHVGWFGAEVAVKYVVFRPAGSSGNAVVTAAVLAIAFAVLLVGQFPTKFKLITGVFIIFCIALTLSRSGIITIAVILFWFAVFYGRGRAPKLLHLASIGALVSLPFFYLSQSGLIDARLNGTGSDATRFRNLGLALDSFLEAPLFGLGLGGFGESFSKNAYLANSMATTADNTFLTILVEFGLLGTAALVMAFVALSLRRSRFRVVSAVPLVAWLASGLFFDPVYHDGPFFLLGVALLYFLGEVQTDQPSATGHYPLRFTSEHSSRSGDTQLHRN
ncbi:O-antigen ligase [Dietzia sp. Die43]|uniref:O-antigen ligase family protein n=1 Tax=Dietzia sp. Die43 TaxID=2926011 RepID=UPI00211959C6|nr:O-antigen ligase family protein [Dietzia sp. Die43]